MKKVAVYIRVSNHRNAEASMQKQEQKVREYCNQNGYTVGEARCVVGDPKTAYPMLLALLNDAKEKGIDTVVMPSTKNVTGRVQDIEMLNSVFQQSGVAIETLDGSHHAFASQNMGASFLAAAVAEEEAQHFGYDNTAEGMAINEAEAEVVRYVFGKFQEYTENPPADLVQAVIDDYKCHGADITYEDAVSKVPMQSIVELISAEVREQWPEQYKSLIEKQAHNSMISAGRINNYPNVGTVDMNAEPIINRDMWAAVQDKLAEDQSADGQQMADITM